MTSGLRKFLAAIKLLLGKFWLNGVMKTLDVFDSPCDSAGWELAGEALVPGAGGGALQQDWAYGVIAAAA